MKKLFILIISILVSSLPMVTAQAAQSSEPPSITSEAAIMIDAETGDVLFAKNAHASMYPASLTKIATAIYAIENGDLDSIATVSKKARNIEGTRVYLAKGEKVTLKKLIQGLLINSGNDAGVAIAEHLSGSVASFAKDLNNYLEEKIGVWDTNFENPHGLFNPNHVTTAADLAQITKYAMQNETFREIFGTVALEWHGESWDTTLLTHHKLMRQMPYVGITGGKTGFVDQSGFTLATTAERENLSLIVITLKTNFQAKAYDDTKHLLDYGFANFTRATIPKATPFNGGIHQYNTSEKITYTRPLHVPIRKEVDKNGLLKISNMNGDVIKHYQLKRANSEIPAKVMPENDVNENTVLTAIYHFLLL
ncbi:D-alanyl-D-alanine carboxypeptidase [Lentibacillus cibarius]|uniref:D-alanyl-D-alanine carboxypeptidase n=1 Tax=Lentibacillus cibarius TaxID=2583219 RepID=A0A549YI53_9BACI|nr:D-alanyl-D-alanine carboxypeptidase family protein [Lentibacillus cibarius]TRM11544.1 D-alanyl-D-alanine carboxypeptidase [Lentibacillus cibarius]